MDAGVVALVLLSALLHAGWNIVLKVKGDRLLVMTLIANGASLIALCLIPFAPVPPLALRPYFATSLVLQCGYHVFLIQAYRYGGDTRAGLSDRARHRARFRAAACSAHRRRSAQCAERRRRPRDRRRHRQPRVPKGRPACR